MQIKLTNFIPDITDIFDALYIQPNGLFRQMDNDNGDQWFKLEIWDRTIMISSNYMTVEEPKFIYSLISMFASEYDTDIMQYLVTHMPAKNRDQLSYIQYDFISILN